MWSLICQNWGFLNFEVSKLVKSLLTCPLKFLVGPNLQATGEVVSLETLAGMWQYNTVEQQVFTSWKFSQFSRNSWDSRIFHAREYFRESHLSVRTSAIWKFVKISCTRIACMQNSRNFHVAKISCSTVYNRPTLQENGVGIHVLNLWPILMLSHENLGTCNWHLDNPSWQVSYYKNTQRFCHFVGKKF